MFDNLNDPDPPIADVATLNQVAKRADRLRRRRALIIGTGAGALVVALTIATIAIVKSDDPDGQLVVDVPPTDVTVTTLADTASTLYSTSTTVASVVVPPPATTLAPAPDTTVAPETTVVETTVALETTTTLPATTTTVPIATGPIVAIDANGDAVIVALDGANTVLFDGPDPDEPPAGEGETSGIDGVAITPDGTRAYIGLCCEPVVGTLLQTTPPAMANVDDSVVYGHGPAIAPGGGLLARIVYDTLTVSDLAINDLATVPEDFDVGFTYDLAWADDQHLLALRLGPGGTDLRVFTFSANTLTAGASATIFGAAVDPVQGASFAGRGDGVIYILGVIPGTLTAYDSTTLAPIADRNIAVVGAVSAWVEGGAVRWVDSARQLHVGDAIVPGQYLWVR
ncbi:MAG: hypothetical protein ABIR32_07590 [Ilumatobacteraceae bacterium]